MNKEYVCTLDNRTFLTKEEMIAYVSSRYLREVTHSEEMLQIKEAFTHAFPQAILSFSTTNNLFEDLYIDHTSSDFKDTVFYGLLTSHSFKGQLPFAISSSYGNDYNQDLLVFKDEKNAISYFQSLFHASAYFSQKARSLIQHYNDDISDVVLDSIFYQYHDYSPTFSLVFEKVTKNGEKTPLTTLDIDSTEIQDDVYIKRKIKAAISSLSSHFISVVEGVPLECEEDYHGSVFYEIDGIDINTLASRAKTMKITILE